MRLALRIPQEQARQQPRRLRRRGCGRSRHLGGPLSRQPPLHIRDLLFRLFRASTQFADQFVFRRNRIVLGDDLRPVELV